MQGLNISVNPTYYCNARCHFCYLTEEMLSNRNRIDLTLLKDRLDEVNAYTPINQIDLYGGEVFMLEEDYLLKLIDILFNYSDDINIITNLMVFPRYIHEVEERCMISVSYDFHVREKEERVFNNMLLLHNPFSVLSLASPELMEIDEHTILSKLSLLSHLEAYEVKPYSSNQSNQLNVSYSDFEAFMKRLITANEVYKLPLTNTAILEDTITGRRNAFSDDHIYITPHGDFGVLDFDEKDNEYFLRLKHFSDYLNWCEIEKQRVKNNAFCQTCPYLGQCLSEHLREVKNLDNSCNGFYHLIEWYKNYAS